MNFDKEALSKLAKLSNEELRVILQKIAAESGVDTSNIKISDSDLSHLRAFLSMANEDDVARLIAQFGGQKK